MPLLQAAGHSHQQRHSNPSGPAVRTLAHRRLPAAQGSDAPSKVSGKSALAMMGGPAAAGNLYGGRDNGAAPRSSR